MLSPENYKEFALGCTTVKRVLEEEFNSTLRKPALIARNIIKYEKTSEAKYLRIALNDVVIFFNLFDRHRGLDLFGYLANGPCLGKAMAILSVFHIDTREYQVDEDFKARVNQEIDV